MTNSNEQTTPTKLADQMIKSGFAGILNSKNTAATGFNALQVGAGSYLKVIIKMTQIIGPMADRSILWTANKLAEKSIIESKDKPQVRMNLGVLSGILLPSALVSLTDDAIALLALILLETSN